MVEASANGRTYILLWHAKRASHFYRSAATAVAAATTFSSVRFSFVGVFLPIGSIVGAVDTRHLATHALSFSQSLASHVRCLARFTPKRYIVCTNRLHDSILPWKRTKSFAKQSAFVSVFGAQVNSIHIDANAFTLRLNRFRSISFMKYSYPNKHTHYFILTQIHARSQSELSDSTYERNINVYPHKCAI